MPKIIEDTDYESSDQSGRTVSVSVEREVDLGSHIMFIGSVTEADVLSDGETVTYGYYQKNIKPKPEKKGFLCKICGYVYDGDVLPEDYICSICKHGAVDFEPLKGGISL